MLGTTLYEMTTMRRLFKRDDDVETVKAVRSGAIPRSAEDRRELPQDLLRIVTNRSSETETTATPTQRAFARDLDAFVRATTPR